MHPEFPRIFNRYGMYRWQRFNAVDLIRRNTERQAKQVKVVLFHIAQPFRDAATQIISREEQPIHRFGISANSERNLPDQ